LKLTTFCMAGWRHYPKPEQNGGPASSGDGFYVLGLRAEALERQNRLDRRKNTRKAGEG
jgi:hypothetical protein